MAEGLLILALILLVIFFADMKSKQERIEKQDSTIRQLKGEENEDDKLMKEKYAEYAHFKIILEEVKKDEIYEGEFHKGEFLQFQLSEAYDKFYEKYGYNFSDPFNDYPSLIKSKVKDK